MKPQEQNISAALASATCALLGTACALPARASDADQWNIDTAVLYYGESDSRVQDISGTIAAQRDFGDEHVLGLTVSADTLTGASPSGASATATAQTFTSPSGRATYTTPANAIPLDDTFHDTRFAVNGNWTQPLASLYKISVGGGFSSEYDYQHFGANFSLARDFNKRNTTLSAGLAWSQDTVKPVGGTPVPLSEMLDVADGANKRGDDTKNVLDAVFGLTQVLNRTTVLRLNYSYSKSNGYLNDPYKIVSVVDPLTGEVVARTPAAGVDGPSGVYLYESRPDTRAKQSFYAEVKHAFGAPVLNLSYRFMTDDWGIDSHTGEVKMRWPLGAASYLEPNLRYYRQNEADFYRVSLVEGEPLPRYASADYRLGKFDAATIGLKFGHRTPEGNEWSVRGEYYRQSGDIPADQLVGTQTQRAQYPDMNAFIVQFGYRFGW